MTRAEYAPIDGDPGKIRDLVTGTRWNELDGEWNKYVRQVLDNIRMIEGRHWDIWIDSQKKFVDVSRDLSHDDDRRFRQRPTFNWIGYWYHQTLAKLTENPPVLTFMPSTGDRRDTELAEIMDHVFKYLWRVCDMDYNLREYVGMMVATGSAVLKSFWDPSAGEMWEARGFAPYNMMDDSGMPVMSHAGDPEMMIAENAPMQLGPSGELVPMIEPTPGGNFKEIGGPARIPEGQIGVRILSPLDVRTAAGLTPFHQRRWYVERTDVDVQDIYEQYGVSLEPEEDEYVGQGLHQGTGFGFGSPLQREYGKPSAEDSETVTVFEMWEQPREEAPEGRHTVCTRDILLTDGPNPYSPTFRPYERCDFLNIPGRMLGKSPIEDLAPMNRVYNRGWGQVLEHRTLMTNPFYVVDASSGVTKLTNEPGQVIPVNRKQSIPAIEPIVPPPLPESVYLVQSGLKEEMRDFGSLRQGSEGRSPTRAASGELVKELRANDDRYLATPTASVVGSLARMADQWSELLRFGWPEEKIIRVSGEDNAARFMSVQKIMFQGNVHARGVVESMLPEGRQDRQQRIDWWVMNGLLTPDQYFDIVNYPHLSRAAHAGGVDKSMAEQENTLMQRGGRPNLLTAHDDVVHMESHRRVVASPEFFELEHPAQVAFLDHMAEHQLQMEQKLAAAAEAAGMGQEPQGDTSGGKPGGASSGGKSGNTAS